MEIRAPLVTKVDVPVTTLTALATLNPEQFPVLLDSAAQGPLARYSMAMFEPRANVDYAAKFLKTLRGQEGSWTLAVARYHAGPNNNPAQKKYVCTVIANMVATGFGSWTEPARAFCA